MLDPQTAAICILLAFIFGLVLGIHLIGTLSR
jgi:hypothetical protein